MSLGPTEILIILLVVMILFGGSRLAQVGKGLGEGIRNFKNAVSDADSKAGAPKENPPSAAVPPREEKPPE